MRVLITGGHLAPALSVIEVLPKDTRVLIVGRKYTFEGDKNLSFEYQVAQALKIPFKSITTGRLQRVFTQYTVPSLVKIPLGFIEAFRIVYGLKPDIILSFGGYISLPVVLSGVVLKVPIVIHEQTIGAGLASRIEGIFAKKVCISFPTSRKYFQEKKTILTGNPIRQFKIGRLPFNISQEKIPLLYITGGSAGSHTINLVIEKCIKKLLYNFKVIHQTGDSWDFKDFDRLRKLREDLTPKLKKRYFIAKFIEPSVVGTVIKNADLVISRGGINTVTELIYFAKPSIIIPLNNEQMENAKLLKNTGFGEIIEQNKPNGIRLYNLIKTVMKKKSVYNKNINRSAFLLAAKKIIDVLNEETRGERTKKEK